MRNQWRLFCDTLWPEPSRTTSLSQQITRGRYRHTDFLVSYQNHDVKSCIRNNKFHFHTQSAKALAQIVDQYLAHHPTATILPLPSSTRREQSRGYKHLLHILQYSQYKKQVRVDVLRKLHHTPQQSHVTKAVRLQQQRGSFACNAQAARTITGPIILFDDVVTTESTMAAARHTLTPHVQSGVQIICFAIAH